MFAPPVKATAPKAAARAATTRNLKEAQHKSDIDHEQETRRARTDHPKAVLRASLDFSKIPIFAPDQPASFQPLRVQPKLTVGAINDPLEQEADRVADQVTRMPDPEPSVASVPAQLGRKCATCEDEDKKLQKKLATPQPAANEAPAIVHEVLRTPGQPLDAATRDYFEPRFGHDFSRVRVHSDAEAAESAREVNARAYTIRNNIVFAMGRFAPGTREGRQLLAHELTHVAQQEQSGVAMIQCYSDTAVLAELERSVGKEDTKAQRLRIEHLTKIFSDLDSSQADSLLKRLKERKEGDKLAAEFHYRLSTKSREKLLAILQDKAVRIWARPITLLSEDIYGRAKRVTDEEINAPLTEAKKRDEEEAARLKEVQFNELREKTKDWGADHDFAAGLLNDILQHNLNPDSRGVADAIRKPILKRYEKWLKAVDKQRLDECAAHPPGLVETSRAKFATGFDPCESWFKESWSHGPSELADLERLLKVRDRPSGASSAETVYQGVLEYRMKTDPYWINMARMAGEMTSGFAALGRAPEPIGAPPPSPARASRPTGTGEPPVPSTRTTTDPKTPPKRTVITQGEETRSTGVTRTEEDPTGFRGEKKRPPAQKIGKEPTEERSSKVGGKKGDEPEHAKGGKMTETLAEPALSAKAVDHVFQGDEFGGYHSTARGADPNVKVLKVREKPDTNGVYKVKLEIRDPKTGKVVIKNSTMFPDNWSEQKVLDETYAVMRANPPGAPNSKGISVAEGTSPSGVVIRIDYRKGVPDSFYPVHTNDQ